MPHSPVGAIGWFRRRPEPLKAARAGEAGDGSQDAPGHWKSDAAAAATATASCSGVPTEESPAST